MQAERSSRLVSLDKIHKERHGSGNSGQEKRLQSHAKGLEMLFAEGKTGLLGR